MIDGLKVLVPGHELKKRLDERVQHHLAREAHWKREEKRLAASHRWRADVLSFFRDRVDVADSYRLGEEDLEFAGLLPERPDLVGPADEDEDEDEDEDTDLVAGRDLLTPS